jgi:hypothetical protein
MTPGTGLLFASTTGVLLKTRRTSQIPRCRKDREPVQSKGDGSRCPQTNIIKVAQHIRIRHSRHKLLAVIYQIDPIAGFHKLVNCHICAGVSWGIMESKGPVSREFYE